jgi:hypothetical protein
MARNVERPTIPAPDSSLLQHYFAERDGIDRFRSWTATRREKKLFIDYPVATSPSMLAGPGPKRGKLPVRVGTDRTSKCASAQELETPDRPT